MSQPDQGHRDTVRHALSRNIVVDVGARVGYLLTRFFIPPFVLARVSLDAYGLWATVFILVSYVGISTLGISNAYVKFVAEYAARGEHRRANALLSSGLAVTVPLCLAIFLVVWWGWSPLADWLNIAPAMRGEAREVVLTVVGIFLASLSLSAFRDALTGAQRTAEVQLIWTVAYVLETGLIFYLVSQGRGIRGLAEAFLIRTILELVLWAWCAFRRLPWLHVSPRLVERASLRQLFSFGGVVQLTSLLAIALNSIERAVAAPLAGLGAAGLLDIGKKLPAMAASIPSAFASSFLAAASYLQGGMRDQEEGREAIYKLMLKGGRYMNLAAAYLLGFMVPLAQPLLDTWLGRRFADTALLLVLFSVATQFHLMTGPGTSILKGLGRPLEEFHYSLSQVLLLAIAIPLSRVLAGAWTVLGLGTAVALATIGSAVYFICRANRLLDIPLKTYARRVFLPGLLPYVVGGLVALPAVMLVDPGHRWGNAVVIGVAGCAYTLLLGLAVDRLVFDQGERWWFRAIIGQRLGPLRRLWSRRPA